MKTYVHVGGRLRLPEEDILFLEGNLNYTNVYTRSGKKYLVATTLKLLEDRFSGKFFRSHKKYIINLKEIAGIHDYQISMANHKEKILVSRRRKSGLLREIRRIKPSVLRGPAESVAYKLS